MTDTLVLAIGNTLMGDDAIGQAILEELQGYRFTPEITFLDGGAPRGSTCCPASRAYAGC